MLPLWIPTALASAVLVSCRQLYIKRHCQQVAPDLLIFSTRLWGFLLLGTIALIERLGKGGWSDFARLSPIHEVSSFAMAITITVIVTAAATIAQITVIQRDELSLSIPFLSLIPLFMLPWSFVLLGELPTPIAALGMVAACAGAYAMGRGERNGPLRQKTWNALWHSRGVRWMLGVAIALGLTTTCDKIAIRAANAFTYTLLWMFFSTLVMSLICLRHPRMEMKRTLLNRHNLMQTGFWTAAFTLQMLSVELALKIPSGTAYVKTLTLCSTLITVGVGGMLFKERSLFMRLCAALLMLLGSLLVVLGA